MNKKEYRKQWHMGFYGAIELEFRNDRDNLEFLREYQLSKKPLTMDMLIVKKNKDVELENDIGKIFRTHNIIEYKNPYDSLGIDQFYKGIAYVCFYKSSGEKCDIIKSKEITLTFIRDVFPKKLFKQLKADGHEINNVFPGIYYVNNNLPFPVQIIVTSKASSENHLFLKALSENFSVDDAREFVDIASSYSEQGDRENADAIFWVSVAANAKSYELIKEGNSMYGALRELMKDEIDEEIANAKDEERLGFVRELMKNLKMTAEQALESLGIPKSEHQKYINML